MARRVLLNGCATRDIGYMYELVLIFIVGFLWLIIRLILRLVLIRVPLFSVARLSVSTSRIDLAGALASFFPLHCYPSTPISGPYILLTRWGIIHTPIKAHISKQQAPQYLHTSIQCSPSRASLAPSSSSTPSKIPTASSYLYVPR